MFPIHPVSPYLRTSSRAPRACASVSTRYACSNCANSAAAYGKP
jgi:hypothetical protein